MKIRVLTGKFKKDYKLLEKRGYDLSKIDHIMMELINERKLPLVNNDHDLIGNYVGCRECHIEADWLLIYELTKTEIYFYRTGTHSDLF
ncbi:MAG: type II toxin-antitoxin system YafQ family toxin [Oscillospiraceae bacterium]|nr:type II toxin-antitoxin system YafQ family toxin [Oscillospiraceae bacterium]